MTNVQLPSPAEICSLKSRRLVLILATWSVSCWPYPDWVVVVSAISIGFVFYEWLASAVELIISQICSMLGQLSGVGSEDPFDIVIWRPFWYCGLGRLLILWSGETFDIVVWGDLILWFEETFDIVVWVDLVLWSGWTWYCRLGDLVLWSGRLDKLWSGETWYCGLQKLLILWSEETWYGDLGTWYCGLRRLLILWSGLTYCGLEDLVLWSGWTWYCGLGRLDIVVWGNLIL